ncbi:tetratricopeptide repeat protein [Aureimonas mangrovi]|uniref:tetratricopeptide repeat protein n=1 Tax=Aureimonas mangrovi TaxID=2758041 RepID=UPI00163DB546|nr:tetratricopeptide repeat protein [Aureimonas mangrovi]
MQILRLSRLALAAALASTALGGTAFATTAREALAMNAETLPGAYLAAKAAQAEGALDAAGIYFDKALEIDPESTTLRQEAMFAYLAEGRFDDGVALARDLADDPDAGKVARLALGIAALRDGRASEAIERLAIEEPSELDQLLIGHLAAWAEAGDGRVSDAMQRVDEINGPPWFPIFNLYQRALMASLDGQDDEARRILNVLLDDRTSVQTSPDAYLAAAEALTQIEARAGDREAALAAAQRGLELAPTYDPLLSLEAKIEAAGDDDAALRESIAAPVRSARDGASEALYILGQAINRGEGQQVALLYFQFADAVADETSPKLLTALAGIAERAGRIDAAIAYYEQVPTTSPYRRTAELQMGLDLWYADRKEEARDHLERAVADYPDDLQAHLAFADVLSANRDYRRAAEVLERAIEIAPEDGANNWNIYYQRGIAYERLKEWDRAEPNFRRALELSPDQPQVLNYLGYSWVDMNRNLEEGLEMIRTAVDLRPNDGYIIDSLGWAYYRLQRFDEAVEELERAVLITPSDPTINDHLGDAYWRVGRQREARFQWERALNANPAPEEDVAEKIRVKLDEGLGPVGSDVTPSYQDQTEPQAPEERAEGTQPAQ